MRHGKNSIMKISNKELSLLVRQAREQGWQVELTNGGHFKWQSPLGRFFFSAQTPSDIRALKNIKRDLRNNGFIELSRKAKRR
jgi:hypothetical protein